MQTTRSSGRTAVHLLFFLSGAAGLVYQIVWMRMLVLVFGSTALAVSTILTAFMSGLALGAWLLGRWADRWRSPLAVYGILEIAIGLYALAVPALFDGLAPLTSWIWNRFHPDPATFSLIKLAGSLLLLLVPTTLMGGTLPVLSRWAAARSTAIGGRVGRLYAINTLGAVAGTLLCGFVLIRFLGMQMTIYGAAATNLALGLAALAVARIAPAATREEAAGKTVELPSSSRETSTLSGRWILLLAVYAVSGFVALVLEVAWTRILTLVIGGSVYAFALMLTAFLAGLALGAAALAPLADRFPRQRIPILAGLLAAAGAAAWGSAWIFGNLPYTFAYLFRGIAEDHVLVTLLQFAACVIVMAPATFLFGGIFPLVVRIHGNDPGQVGRSVGEVYAANTAGTILGAFAGGFILIPALGLQGTVVAVALAELALAGVVLAALAARRVPARVGAVLAAALVLCTFAWASPEWNSLVMNSGLYLYATELPEEHNPSAFIEQTAADYQELFYKEGISASILVGEERENGNIFLAVNGKVDASSGDDMITQVLSAHLPLLLHADPERVLVIGLASGVTAGSVLIHPVAALDVVEIEEAVVEASHYFDGVNNRPLEDRRTTSIVNDGRNHLLFSPGMYDVIISEPSNPWLTGASSLFTREAFDLVARRLGPGGLSLQWIQSYNMALEDLQSLLATYASVFDHVLLISLGGSDLLLAGSATPLAFDLAAMEERMSDLNVAIDMARVDLQAPEDVLALLAMGGDEIRAFTAGARLNTDDNALVEFSAPWSLSRQTVADNRRAMEAFAADPARYVTPEPREDSERARLFLRLAQAHYRRQAYREALAAVERSLALQPGEEAARLRERIAEEGPG